jgi:hypothetical protein
LHQACPSYIVLLHHHHRHAGDGGGDYGDDADADGIITGYLERIWDPDTDV